MAETAEMGGTPGLPKYAIRSANELQKVLHSLDKWDKVDKIYSKSAMEYAQKVVGRVNKEEEKSQGQQ